MIANAVRSARGCSLGARSGKLTALVKDYTRLGKQQLVEEAERLDALLAENADEAKARLQSILDTAVEGIITIDEEGAIEDFNSAAERIFGYRQAEVMGKNVGILMPEPYHSRHDDYLKAYRTTGKAKIIGIGREVVGRRKDGTVFPMDLSVSEVWFGEQRSFCGFVRDISERKQLEKEILAISDRERLRIGQDLHDDLGQHLTGVEFMCQTLEQTLKAKGVEEASAVQEIGRLVRSAIAHTRRLARGLSPIILDPGGLIPALGELAEATAKRFRIRCEFQCPRHFVIDDEATASHLYRIAQEAIQNAIKHGRATEIEIGLTKTPERTALSVRDNGKGILKKLPKKRGMGLRVMGYRAGLIGGSLAVQRRNEGGTTVLCTVHQQSRAGSYEI
ncbi:MAG: Sensor protein FixL [Verrucomicrobia subdivision 3 bacterium]|nr:Sensor protein FixL [Limisphaerales bacterium]MCS1412469.1 Sensor protein FixL [Limisphaerales bacterium]